MFDPSVITEVTYAAEGARLTLEWTTSAPAGTWFQIYIQRALAWWGAERYATVAVPKGLVDVQIGAVSASEHTTDFSVVGFDALGFDVGGLNSSGLAGTPVSTRALLEWTGFGAAEYRILEGALGFDHGGFDLGGLNGSAGTLVGTVAGIESISTDGLDAGPFDSGGLDSLGGTFSWTSDPLTRGDWNFSVVPYDAAGNPGTPSLTTVTITAPPRPPAPNNSGKRLTYKYNAVAKTVTLNWLPSLG